MGKADKEDRSGHWLIPVVLLEKAIDPPTRRRIALQIAGVTQTEIAKRRKISRAVVSQVVNGKDRSDHVELTIAEALGVPRPIIWPEHWPKEKIAEAIKQILPFDPSANPAFRKAV